ncbi:hypothetical protein SCHPADRAFT_840849 [Schizopora paradoxa]|uniref:CxC2-like cysteine cluster KDZ transposase-associated domain-containing protein n=1 Tax=Schizopora paradoxa TaxID=27342 RepID=A0A0H2RHB5_9AGAM|nr:hypothetical protein SCHPADRAFT_840849 [Schizopora paradoxa]
MSAHLSQFLKKFDTLSTHVVATEGSIDTNEICPCNNGHRTTRCNECFDFQPVCDACFITTHASNPFHFAERWNGLFFDKLSQAGIGRIIHLGHTGEPCPSNTLPNGPLHLDVVTLNGVHGCEVMYCECAKADDHWEQLMEVGLFPATLGKPCTAFSFALLKHFDILSSASKLSAMDYVTTLRRATNNAFPEDVPDFYNAFRRIMRVWRAIQINKRAGVFHGMARDNDFNLAVQCPACPQPGTNMPLKFSISSSDKDRHKYTLFLSLDGNFKQQLKIKNCDPEDVELFVAFFSKKENVDAYIEMTTGDVEKSTCANLKANNLQSQLKFVSMVVSGVVSCKCARHDMYQPGATVDLKKGESFAYTDFALRQALRRYEHYPNIVCSYDIACQYSKKVSSRFRTYFPECEETVSNIRFYVPKLHGHGHTEDCQYLFSLDYASNIGRTHGERIESGWAEGNQAGPSTREMNAGHRHETLSCYYNDWNFQLAIRLAPFLAKKLVEARTYYDEKASMFRRITKAMGVARLREWKKLDTTPYIQNGTVYSHAAHITPITVPSMDSIEERLQHADNNIQAACALNKPAHFITVGMRLEVRQVALKAKTLRWDASTQRVTTEIAVERQKIRAEIDTWRKDQSVYMPDSLDLATEARYPEDERLFLPSHIPSSHRNTDWFDDLARFERELRRGQAEDALSNLRLALKYKDSLLNKRRQVAYGNRNRTRASLLLGRVGDLVRHRAAIYRRAREALISLGMEENDTQFPVLDQKDVRLKIVYGEKELGSGKYTGSWIWGEGPRGTLSDYEEDVWEEEGTISGRQRIGNTDEFDR